MTTLTKKKSNRLERIRRLLEKARRDKRAESRSPRPRQPESLQPLAGERDSAQSEWDRLRDLMNQAVSERGEWAGAPMPHESIPLRIEPRYPYQKLNGMAFHKREPDAESMAVAAKLADWSKGNIFPINSWTGADGRTVLVYHQGDHRSKVMVMPGDRSHDAMDLLVSTIDASRCWKLDAEIKACEKLRQLVSTVAYRDYILTGTFLETSKRSGMMYVFRKLRPTLALKADRQGMMQLRAALCLHPIGYYEGTFAGVMVPTDDVIAHLLMMRACEAKFWAKANHHPLREASAGL